MLTVNYLGVSENKRRKKSTGKFPLLEIFLPKWRRKMRVSQGFWGTREHWEILKGAREHEPILREQGNKTIQIRGGNILI